MSRKGFITLSFFIISMIWLPELRAQHILEGEQLRIELDEKGRFSQLTNMATGQNYVPKEASGFLFRIKIDGREVSPLIVELEQKELKLRFPDQIEALIKVEEKKSYFSFELNKISQASEVDAVLWGPVATTISDTVGEFVGVVRNGDFAVGIQALNPKTTGGVLKNEEGVVYDRGTTAVTTDFGSSLQAFTVNRNKKRKITVWNRWKDVPLPAIEEGKLIGSKIAIFGTKSAEVLPIIGTIEVQEGLPHPMIDGKWIKQSREPGRPYMISSFSESNVDTLLDYAEMAGLAGLYHEGPFANWGHFELREDQFPNGREGMKTIVEKAKKRGLRLGVHTLTNFITTNDPFVSPVPDPQLQEIGHSKLSQPLAAADKEIYVESPDPFRQETNLQTVRIGEELIRYQQVTDAKPYKLTGCIRGAFDTKKQNHSKADHIGKLMDHSYKVFFPDWKLQKELLHNMTNFFNETGVTQMDFDGHEGTFATGMGDYSMDKFSDDFYRQVDHHVVNGSSRSNHYYWHINYYLNWGEPWYGGFRESQSDYRFKNQALLDRNYMPNMLGWFLLTPTTTMEDIDWMMARAAGYDAGFAFVARPDALKKNPETEELLRQIKDWEDARQKGIFTGKQEARLRDTDNTFHLEKTGAESWKLHTFKNYTFTHENRQLQPGQPTYSEWTFDNKQYSQVPQIRLLAKGKEGTVSSISLEIDNFFTLNLPLKMKTGQSFVLDDNNFGRLYDNKGRFLREIELENSLPPLQPGPHTIHFDGEFSGNGNIEVEATLKIKGEIQSISH